MKIVAFDLDDVLCYREKEFESLGKDKYIHCKPIVKNIKTMNDCYDNGFYIKIYTARGMTQFDTDLVEIKNNLQQLTIDQLKSWGAKYHELIFGKTHYDLLIDDKAKNIIDIKNIDDVKNFLNEPAK